MKKAITIILFVFLYQAGFAQAWVKKNAVYTGGGGRGSTAFSIPSVGGGFAMGCQPYNFETWKYDTLSDSWISRAAFTGSADGTEVGFSINGIGYMGTGVSFGCGFYNTFYSYDPVGNTWTQLPNVPGPNRGYATGFAVGGRGYIGGGISGCYGTVGFNDFYSYDPVNNVWDTIAPCPEKGCNQLGVGFAIGNYGYIGTGDSIGSNGSGTHMKDFYRYDPSIDKWTKMADFPGGPRQGAVGFATCDKGYIGLGYSDGSAQVCPNDFYEYDPIKNAWKRIADFGGIGRWAAPSFVVGKSCFVALGVAANNATLTDIWEYIPSYTPAFSASNTVCAGQSISFTDTSNYSPANWHWSFPGGTPNFSTEQNPVIRYDTIGTHNVVLTAWNDCDSGTRTFLNYVTVGSSGGTLTITPPAPKVCSGEEIILSVNGGGSAFKWSPGTSLNKTTGDSVTATGSSADSIVYTVMDTSTSGCPATGHVTVYSNVADTAGHVTAIRDTICQNTSGNLSLAGNSSNTIQWQSSTDNIDFTNAVNDTLATYKTVPLQQTTWYRAVVGKGNCSALSDTLKLYVPPTLTASFKASPGGTQFELIFNSDSSLGNISSYHWDFGDSSTSIEKNPSHTYAGYGNYYICLTLYDGSNCSYTFCSYYSWEGVPTESASGNWVIYPNPFNEQLTIAGKQINSGAESVEMYDVLGRLVINKNTTDTKNTSFQLDVSALAKGMYYIMIRTPEANYMQKVVKQ